MKVILKRDVKGLGHVGDVREVKPGYARNFLLPSGAAALADAGALANWERHRDERDAREQGLRSDAEAMAQRLRDLKLEVAVKAGEKNRLFGSVTNREIAELIGKEGIEVDRHCDPPAPADQDPRRLQGRRAPDARRRRRADHQRGAAPGLSGGLGPLARPRRDRLRHLSCRDDRRSCRHDRRSPTLFHRNPVVHKAVADIDRLAPSDG